MSDRKNISDVTLGEAAVGAGKGLCFFGGIMVGAREAKNAFNYVRETINEKFAPPDVIEMRRRGLFGKKEPYNVTKGRWEND